MQNWLETFTKKSEYKKRFTDVGRTLQENSGEISQKDLGTLSNLMMDAIGEEQKGLNVFLGKHLTESRGVLPAEENETEPQTFSEKTDYERESWLRLAYIEEGDVLHFFASGHNIKLALEYKAAIQELCANYYYTASSLKELAQNPDFKQLFDHLLQEGCIYPT